MSDHASPLSQGLNLQAAWNAPRSDLEPRFAVPPELLDCAGAYVTRGIAFDLTPNAVGAGAIVLDAASDAGAAAASLRVDLGGVTARWLVVLHQVETLPTLANPEIAATVPDGNRLGEHVATYRLALADGRVLEQPILRRFQIQQGPSGWGASAFEAQPHRAVSVFPTAGEAMAIAKAFPMAPGSMECRTHAGRDRGRPIAWLYALENPTPDTPLTALELAPGEQAVAIFGLAAVRTAEHPLREWPRRCFLLPLPAGSAFDANDDASHIATDLGTVISARRPWRYDPARWTPETPDAQPEPVADQVVVELAAHPDACLYLGRAADGSPAVRVAIKDLPAAPDQPALAPPAAAPRAAVELPAPHRPVRLRVIDRATRRPVGVRLHIHGQAGEYLPPKGHHRRVNQGWFADTYAEHVTGFNQYAYIPGHCIMDLPLGTVYIEISHGFEMLPIRQTAVITADTDTLTFELGRSLDWHARGWVSADTHVHFLTPSTAQLEGEAEDVNVVNLLASQWGEMFSNVGDFDGRLTHGATESGGDGRFLVRVGTENRMQVLGHISLLGYEGEMIHPLCSGGPSESALGDFLETSMAQWARRCRDQRGLVVMPHAPNPQCERAATIVAGLVDALEIMQFNPVRHALSPYAFADWYRWLDLGYQIPLVGGSDKMAATSLLGGVRTFAQLGDRPFTYEAWMQAVRAGHTFVSIGPLLEFSVDGQPAGSRIALPKGGGSLTVTWRVASVRLPVQAIEVVVGGETRYRHSPTDPYADSDSATVRIGPDSTWIALRLRGSYQDRADEIAAHSSAVMVIVNEQPVFSRLAAGEVLNQIEGAMAYVDTLASRPDQARYRAIRAELHSAWNTFHQRLHAGGVFHHHHPHHHHPEHDG